MAYVDDYPDLPIIYFGYDSVARLPGISNIL